MFIKEDDLKLNEWQFSQRKFLPYQALLQWKYEYLMKQEQWLIELMCGKREEEKQEEKQ